MTLGYRQVDFLFLVRVLYQAGQKRNLKATELLEPQPSRAEWVCS